jgi:hypothetical protein
MSHGYSGKTGKLLRIVAFPAFPPPPGRHMPRAAAGIRGISSTAAAPGGNYNEFERIFSVWHIETQK